MSHPREHFERLLDVFDAPFKKVAKEEGFVFDPRVGHVGRALRLKSRASKRGVFLDLKDHWMKSDRVDPEVVLTYGAWSQHPSGLPVLLKVLYEGKLSDLTQSIEQRLHLAVSQVKAASEEAIRREGKTAEDFFRGS